MCAIESYMNLKKTFESTVRRFLKISYIDIKQDIYDEKIYY